VLDAEVLDAVLHDAEQADVGLVDDVGDVAVGEDVAGLEAEDGGLRDAGVGAADPEDLGRLALTAFGKEVGVFLGRLLGPTLVGLEGLFERGVCDG